MAQLQTRPADDSSYPRACAFVVQFAAVSGAGSELAIRVEHVASGRSAHFTSTQDLLAFFSEVLGCEGRIGMVGPASTDPPKVLEDRARDFQDRKQAEETRLQGERQYRMVVEAATDAVITIDENSVITLVNPAVTRIFGYSSAEIVGRPLTVLMPHDVAARHVRAIREYVQTDDRHINWDAVEATAVRRNGEQLPVEISFAEVVTDRQRTFTGFIRDITERKQAEAMRAAHARQVGVRADVSAALAKEGTLRHMLQGCVEAVVKHLDAAFARIWVIKDRRMLELRASAGMYTHLDGPHSRIPVGQLKIGLIAQEGLPHITNDLAHDPRISDPQWAQEAGMVGFAGYPLLVSGQAIGVLAMFARYAVTPVTTEMLATIADAIAQGIQRKQAEEEVRRSEAFLAAAQALSQTGSWGWNTKTGDVSWSRETYRIFGFDPHVAPTLATIRETIHPDDRSLFDQDTERVQHDRTDFEREYRLKFRDGSLKCVHIVGRSVAGAFPDLDFIGSIMDVTERRHAEEAVLAAQAKLAEVSRLTTMGELAASIAHEINQPLATVVTNAQACERLLHVEPPSLEEVHDAVSDIAEAGRRASDVIARIRLLLRKSTPQPTLLDVNEIVREVIAWTRNETGKKNIVVRTDLADLLPIRGDRLQLQQVLINLIRNAADAMGEVHDRPRTLTLGSRCNDEHQVEVTVVDSGVGIDPELRSRIFEPFFTTKPEGMGMGLSICRSIVEAYGGLLTATDNQEFGTTIRFALPAADAEGA
jgi:PAS domain S-box-containing protein